MISKRTLEHLIGQAREELWDVPDAVVEPVETQTVKSDMFDKMTYTELERFAPKLVLDRLELEESYPTSPEAYEDVFNMLHQGDPQFRGLPEMDGEHAANHRLLSELWGTEEFQALRAQTKHDEYATAFSLVGMKDSLAEAFEQTSAARQAQADLAQAVRDAQDAAQRSPQDPDGPEGDDDATDGSPTQQDGQNGQDSQDGQDGQLEAAAEQLAEALAAAQQATQGAPDPGEAVAAAVKTAREVKDDLDNQDKNARSYGLGPGELQHMDFEERRRLMERLNRGRIEHLADLVGAFRAFGDAERRRKIRYAPTEVYDYTLGNDLTKLVSEELTHLAVPELEERFWLRYFRHGLLQKEVRGPQRAGQGPIVVVCDESVSMGQEVDSSGNTREAWSKAVALALADQARRGKRDFTYIGFNTDVAFESTFGQGRPSLDQLLEFTEHFAGGGTAFEPPLARALEIITEAERADRPQPDVVFITDGAGRVSPEFITRWREALDRLDARCYAIQVGSDSSFGDDTLHAIAHRVMQIGRLNANPEGVAELFRTI